MVRFITSQTVLSGCPSLHSVTCLLVNSYSMAPLVPSETFRRYQKQAWSVLATALIAMGAFPVLAPIRLERASPLYVYRLGSVTGPWSQQRVSEGIETK